MIKMTINGEQWLKMSDAAEYVRLKLPKSKIKKWEMWLYKYAEENEIRKLKIGNGNFYPIADLDAFADSRLK